MSSKVIGLYKPNWQRDFSQPARSSRDVLYMLSWARWFKANPRSEDYMRALFTERYLQGVFLDATAVPASDLYDRIAAAETIVLLYPDSIGLGFRRLEQQVLTARNPMAGVRVLNGRHRDFVFSRSVKCRLRFRRVLEMTMLPELCVGAAMLLATPFLLAIDLLRGRK